MNDAISVIIPTYNGADLLGRYLPSVSRAVEAHDPASEIIVVDNGSSDGTAALLARDFPRAVLVSLPENLGFGPACNIGARRAARAILLFVNNDIAADGDFITPCLRRFDSPGVFAVYPTIHVPVRGRAEGRKRRLFRFDMYKTAAQRTEDASGRPGFSIYPPGACFFVRRDLFLDMGGFHDIFAPFFWEDIDIGYRAWKRGWRTVFAPEGRVLHMESSTSRRVSRMEAYAHVAIRNKIFFVWTNYSDPLLLARHFATLLFKCYEAAWAGKGRFFTALREAWRRRGEVMEKRAVEGRRRVLGDRRILRAVDERLPGG